MKMKTLLLGSAAAFTLAGANAQAADLSVAEPVDYVRVCDAFGTGYYYIPGTDTCLKISGLVRFEVKIDDDSEAYDTDDDGYHEDDWRFHTRGTIIVESKSMTDWGPLYTYIEAESNWERDFDDGGAFTVQEAYVSLGPILAGKAQSAFDNGGGYTYEGYDLTDNKPNQLQLSWALNGFGIILAAEDPYQRYDDGFPNVVSAPDAGASEVGDMPDLVAAITGEGEGWNAKLGFLYSDYYEGLWAVQGAVEFKVFGNDSFLVHALYGDADDAGSQWAILASYKHFWQSNLYSAVTVRYDDVDADVGDDTDGIHVAFNTVYSPVEDFAVGAEVRYTDIDDDDDWSGLIRIQRDFGG